MTQHEIDLVYDILADTIGYSIQVINPDYVRITRCPCIVCRRDMSAMRIVYIVRRNTPYLVTYYCLTCGSFTDPIDNYIDCSR
ncbi:MAG: hypothetical protein ACPGO5_02560 [Patescibacteria group bacterium]